jgi:hypothetical protein
MGPPEGAKEGSGLIEQFNVRRKSLVKKHLEGVDPDDLFREQLEIIDTKLADAYLPQQESAIQECDLESLMELVKDKLGN